VGATRSVAKNTILLTLGLLTGRALSVYLITKMTPILGTAGMGMWGLATDLPLILLVITRFGLDTMLTREVTRAKGNTLPLFWATLRIRWAVGALCYLFLLLFVRIEEYDSLLMTAVMISGVGIFVESTSMACDSVLQAHEKVQYQSLGQILSAIIYFVLGWIWLDMGHGLMGVIYNKIDILMLKNMMNDSAVGIYTLGHKALDMMIILPNLFGTAFFPAMARYGQKSSVDAVRLGERALRYMMVVMVPATLFVTFVAVPIINFFDKNGEFGDSHRVLMIVIWALPFQAGNILFNRLIITAGREKVFMIVGLVPMIANIVMNAVFIPRYGYFGASVATIVSYSLSFSMLVLYLHRTEYRVPLGRAVVGPLFATATAWMATSALGHVAFPQWQSSWHYLSIWVGCLF